MSVSTIVTVVFLSLDLKAVQGRGVQIGERCLNSGHPYRIRASEKKNKLILRDNYVGIRTKELALGMDSNKVVDPLASPNLCTTLVGQTLLLRWYVGLVANTVICGIIYEYSGFWAFFFFTIIVILWLIYHYNGSWAFYQYSGFELFCFTIIVVLWLIYHYSGLWAYLPL